MCGVLLLLLLCVLKLEKGPMGDQSKGEMGRGKRDGKKREQDTCDIKTDGDKKGKDGDQQVMGQGTRPGAGERTNKNEV